MKKKKFILFIILGLFGFLELNNVQALEACTDAQIKDAMTNARATLSVSVFSENISIPSLGRTASNGKANIYKMSMSAGFSGRANSAFCLDSDKSARSGTVYKIDHEVTSQKWKKAYQYGMEYKNDDIKYIVAQASLWLLRDQKSWENNLAPVAEDIYVNKNWDKWFWSHW